MMNVEEIMRDYYQQKEQLENRDTTERRRLELSLERLRDNKEKEIQEYLEKLISYRDNFYSGYIDRVRRDLEQAYEDKEKELEEQIEKLSNSNIENELENLKKETVDKLTAIREDLEKQLAETLEQYNDKIRQYGASATDGSQNPELLREAEELRLKSEDIKKQIDKIDEYIVELGAKTKTTTSESYNMSEYLKALKEYEQLLEIYNEEVEKLFELNLKYMNKEIEYSEYEAQAIYVAGRYKYMKELYEKLKNFKNPYLDLSEEELLDALKKLEAEFDAEYQFRAHNQNGMEYNDDNFIEEYRGKKKLIQDQLNRKNNPYSKMSDEELLDALKRLEAEFDAEYKFRAHNQNGMEYNDDNFIEEYRRKKKLIQDEIDIRKKKQDDLVPPINPGMILEDAEKDEKKEKDEEKEKIYDLDYLIGKIRGRGYKYNKFDGFVYKYKGIKVWNWHKFNGRTFADKPFKLIKSVIGSAVFGINKLFSKAVYKSADDLRARIEQMIQNIEQLTNDEVDFLIQNFAKDGNKQTELYGVVPNVVVDALMARIRKRKAEKLSEANALLSILYDRLLNNYKKCKDIKNTLDSNNLSPSERESLMSEFKKISNDLLEVIKNIDTLYNETTVLVSEQEMNRVAAKEGRKGGRNSGVGDDPAVSDFVSDLGESLKHAREEKDGFIAAEMFIYKHKVKIENTNYKRTLKNRFGKANVGVYEWRPYVENIDYAKHDFWGDTLRFVTIIVSVANAVNQIKMRNEMAQMKEQMQQMNNIIIDQNNKIQKLNDQLLDLQIKLAKATGNPQDYLDKYAEYLRLQAAQFQAACDYWGATAEAGLKNLASPSMNSQGDIYPDIDGIGHEASGSWMKTINDIQNDASLSAIEKINKLKDTVAVDMANQTQNVANLTKSAALSHIGQKTTRFDFTALEAFYNSTSSADPTFLSKVYTDLYEIAVMSNNIKALSLIQTFDISQGTASLVPMVAQLTAVIGVTALTEYQRNKEKNKSIAEMKAELQEKIENTEINEHEIAKKEFEAAMEKWNEKSAFYRMFHRKEKPKMIDFEQEAFNRGRGL